MRKMVPILVVLFFAASDWAQKVSYNFDSQADFSKYKTFRWEEHPNSVNIDDLTKKELGAALNAQLATKGLTNTTDANADLVLVYQLALRQEKELTTLSSGYGYGPGWRGGWYGGMGSGISTTTANTINIGSLDVDMYDAAAKKLVWRGVVSKAINEKAKPDKRQKNMQKAAKKLFKNYPPPQK
jgi:hypothetical protein